MFSFKSLLKVCVENTLYLKGEGCQSNRNGCYFFFFSFIKQILTNITYKVISFSLVKAFSVFSVKFSHHG